MFNKHLNLLILLKLITKMNYSFYMFLSPETMLTTVTIGGAKCFSADTEALAFDTFNSFYNSLLFLSFSSSSEVFCDSEKNILKENDIVRFPKLADTYQRIAEEGPDVFYNGSMAQSIIEDIQAAGLLLFPCFFRDN